MCYSILCYEYMLLWYSSLFLQFWRKRHFWLHLQVFNFNILNIMMSWNNFWNSHLEKKCLHLKNKSSCLNLYLKNVVCVCCFEIISFLLLMEVNFFFNFFNIVCSAYNFIHLFLTFVKYMVVFCSIKVFRYCN